ncbi:MAG: glycerophosphoryl diester phosphodiesterase [Frankiales bacterium]|nr:glycerophosphoryl diester phosphodiesterase [Frankiales bacterium]
MLGFAHRGGMADAPENSLEAFHKALAAGATGLESDVWLSADGTPVLHHGPPHRERRVPVSLAELFASCGTDFDLSLDLKGPGAAEATIVAARDAGFTPARLWLCAGRGTCERLRLLAPELRLVCDLTWREALFGVDAALHEIAAISVDAVNLRHGRWTRRMVRKTHEAGLLAFAWDVNNRLALRLAVRREVDGIYSDHVRLLGHLPR